MATPIRSSFVVDLSALDSRDCRGRRPKGDPQHLRRSAVRRAERLSVGLRSKDARRQPYLRLLCLAEAACLNDWIVYGEEEADPSESTSQFLRGPRVKGRSSLGHELVY